MGIARVLQELVGWLDVLASVAGVVVCALRLGRSRWIGLLMGGFAVEALVTAFFRLVGLLVGLAGGYENLAVAFALVSGVGLLGLVAVVAGLAGVFADAWGGAGGAPEA